MKHTEDGLTRLHIEIKEQSQANLHDFNTKLESRVNDLTRQITNERSERTRFQDQFCSQFEQKNRLTEEKLVFVEKESKQSQNDLVINIQALFKKQADRMSELYHEINKVTQTCQKSFETVDLKFSKQLSDNNELIADKLGKFSTDLEQVWSVFGKECEKIGNIIKEEIGARFQSDVYNN